MTGTMQPTLPTRDHARPTGRRRSAIALVWFAVAGLFASVLGVVVMSSTGAQAVPPAVSATLTDAAGIPRWYSDQNGVRVEPCLDPADPFCIVLANPGVFDPAQPVVFPTNYPDEAFYYILDADRIATPGCNGTRPGTAQMRVALEHAFSGGVPAVGDAIVFGRVRINVTGGLCPNSQYRFDYPFGTVTATTDAAGSIARNQGTTDIGCLVVPCNVSLPLTSTVLQGMPKWDPLVQPQAPAGYLGDPNVLHTITGGPAGNTFRVRGPGANGANFDVRTTLFNVAGKIAGSLQASPEKVDAGNQPVGTPSTPRTITFTNVGPGAVDVTGVTVTPAGGPWTLTGTTCNGAIALDATCTATVVFTPSALGAATATITVTHSGLHSPMTYNLTGVGVPGGPPSVSIAPTASNVGRVLLTTTSGTKDITISNAGPGTFVPTGVTFADRVPPGSAGDAGSFSVVSNTCGATVDPGTSCVIKVALTPTEQRAYAATLTVAGTVDGAPLTLTSTIDGRGGLAASSAGPDGVGPDGVNEPSPPGDGFPTWYQDDRGVRLSQCLVAADPNCIVLPDAGFDPAQPVVFPTNYPGEAFYYIIDSDLMATPGCGAASPPGRAQFRAATEATFGTGAPLAGDQMVFDRIRVNVVSGLCPGQNYTFVHPYGTFSFTADAAGGLARSPGTTDVGCFPGPGTPCNFNEAVLGKVSDGYVRWDATAPAPPAGYLGDANTLHTVAGAPYVEPGAAVPANYVKILDSNGAVVVQTNLFTVAGKIDPTQTATRYETVTPVAADFGNQTVGTTSAARTITIESVGTSPLGITGATVTGADAADFTVVNGCPAALPVAARCTMTVTFQPGAAGARTATLHVTSNAALGSSVPLSGTGLPVVGVPVASVAPASLTFPAAGLGVTSAAQTVTVTNAGNADLTVTGATITGAAAVDFAATNGCLAAVPQGTSCDVTVTFTPTTGGARAASLAITTDGGNATVALTGTGTAPGISVTPGSLTFPTTGLGTPSAARTVTVTNTGNAPLDVTQPLTVTGDFAATGCGTAVAPGGTCTVSVVFTPTANGARTGTLTLASNAGAAPTVALAGTGAAAGTPVLAVAPPSLTFAARNLNTTSPVQNVTVTNNGTANLVVTAPTAAGLNAGNFIVTNGCAAPVAPGATCTVGVAFRPTGTGARTASLAINSNGGNVTVPLSGTGNGAVLALAPTSLTFPRTAVGVRSAAQTITITNTGNQNLNKPTLALGGAQAADYNANSNCPNALVPGGTCTISVTFRPRAVGNRTAILTVSSNGGTATASLAGTA